MRHFILGTDWWTDCDDAVALRLLARAHRADEIHLDAIIMNAAMEYSVASLEGFLNTEKVCDIPIGIDVEATDFGGNPPYQKRLAAFCDQYRDNQDAEDAVKLYRRTLAGSGEKLEIIEIGYLQAIAALLQSPPDEISPLNGIELVHEKVSKIWVMAGKWDEENGKENNFTRNQRSRRAGSYFCEHCPVPVTFLGWEVGRNVLTGGELDKEDVLYGALCDHGSFHGRDSWDPMLVLLALIGDEKAAGYDTVRGIASVDADSGANRFRRVNNGKHMYVIKSREDDYYKNMINEKIKTQI